MLDIHNTRCDCCPISPLCAMATYCNVLLLIMFPLIEPEADYGEFSITSLGFSPPFQHAHTYCVSPCHIVWLVPS